MKRNLLRAALIAAGCIATAHAFADDHDGGRYESESRKPVTIAVFGDWPYNQNLLDNAALLTGSINKSKDVSLVLHVGDIHSGSMACTSAGILPPIPTSNPGWNQKVYYQLQQFNAPVVYTPGDNEWSDCHKSKEQKSGDPLKELAAVRSLFFAKAGLTLGRHERKVATQAKHFDPAYPADAQFVENVMWQDSDVVFVTVNMPGSNNDTLPWTNGFGNAAAQANEVTERTAADIRWLRAAFDRADREDAKAVVIAQQANMWDPEALATGGDGLSAYKEYVQELADLSTRFGRPVLLLNGDSHVYGSDRPLADPTSATGLIHGTQAVPNLVRVTVQGSTTAPGEWLKLTIDPRTKDVFSWKNVPYCLNPTGSCQ